MIKHSSWIQRWQRRVSQTSDPAEFERLLQKRLYGERRVVRRLSGAGTPEAANESQEVDESIGAGS